MEFRMLRQFDWILMLCMLALVGLGVLVIYSATYQTAHAELYIRQLQWLAFAMIAFLIVLQIDYHVLTDFSLLFYLFALALLVAVLIFGKRISGAKSWFSLGYFNFQPSEIAKITSILLLARYLSSENKPFPVIRPEPTAILDWRIW